MVFMLLLKANETMIQIIAQTDSLQITEKEVVDNSNKKSLSWVQLPFPAPYIKGPDTCYK